MILVAGGTGTLGRETVSRLTAAGDQVRVLTRDAARASGMPVEVAVGDVGDLPSLRTAMRGVSAVVSAVHGFLGGRGAGPDEVDHQGNRRLIQAASENGVDHFVLVSVLDARPDHPMSLHRAKYAAEQDLRASPLSWTVLRPSSYVETWMDIVGANLDTSGPGLVFGRATNPINFVSVRDVAAVVERALTDPNLQACLVDVPGIDNLTMTELAHDLGAEKVRHVPRGALRVLSVLLPAVKPALARQAHAALVMDTADMTADASEVLARFPDLVWHPPSQVAKQRRAQTGTGAARDGND